MLTELATVKARLKIADSDIVDDVLLTGFMALVSGRMQNDCNRVFDRAVNAQFEFRGDEHDLLVDRYPLESVSLFETKNSEAEGWVAVADPVDYLISPGRAVIELRDQLATSRQLGRVTYTGGYVLPADQGDKGEVPAGQTALPAEVEQSVVEQIAHLYKNRDRLGISSVSGDGGGLSLDKASWVWLPAVAAVVEKYTRFRM